MARVADLVERIKQGALLVQLKCDVKIDGCNLPTAGWPRQGQGQTFSIVWNDMRGMFHTHIMPKHWGSRKDGEGRCDEKAESRELVALHSYRSLKEMRVRFSWLEVQRPKHRNGESWLSADWERQSLYDVFQCRNRGWSRTVGPNKLEAGTRGP